MKIVAQVHSIEVDGCGLAVLLTAVYALPPDALNQFQREALMALRQQVGRIQYTEVRERVTFDRR